MRASGPDSHAQLRLRLRVRARRAAGPPPWRPQYMESKAYRRRPGRNSVVRGRGHGCRLHLRSSRCLVARPAAWHSKRSNWARFVDGRRSHVMPDSVPGRCEPCQAGDPLPTVTPSDFAQGAGEASRAATTIIASVALALLAGCSADTQVSSDGSTGSGGSSDVASLLARYDGSDDVPSYSAALDACKPSAGRTA